ncbi:MAG: hypothetical protein MSG64_20590 [Pyrinomonadaceae bacterium MAG19_C2-C3]|nr:hypothetical protein [Pyrinomonadaceae bacterium MAG19_C2-C3]
MKTIMGMFDELRCEYPLPDAAVQDAVFQTKSFDRAMTCYTITADGRLVEHTARFVSVPEEERPYYGKPEWESPVMRIAGSMKKVSTGDEEVPYHRDVYFYTSLSEQQTESFEWFEYQARFTEGRLQWIKRVEQGARGRDVTDR